MAENSDLNAEKSDLNAENSDLNAENSDLNAENRDLNGSKLEYCISLFNRKYPLAGLKPFNKTVLHIHIS